MFVEAVAPSPPALSSSTNALEPDRAIVPRLDTRSARLMPIPESVIVNRRRASSVVMVTSRAPGSAPFARWACRHFSRASLAFDTSSRTNTSLSVYSEFVTMSSRRLVSAWKLCTSSTPADSAPPWVVPRDSLSEDTACADAAIPRKVRKLDIAWGFKAAERPRPTVTGLWRTAPGRLWDTNPAAASARHAFRGASARRTT
mmetsp:Transcript_43418/g.69869  ORF Transcript_43418/g.69869 Transcript_43418/m.69869 type:complete len:201 (-) Transcript_43418:68-670(-)